MKEKRIFIVDDHPLILHGLFHAVNAAEGFCVCGTAKSVAEAEREVVACRPDAMILDLHLPDGDGLGFLQRLYSGGGHIPTLILSVCDEVVYAPRMFAAGARGFMMKDQPLENILAALQKILAGHLAFSDEVVARLLDTKHSMLINPLDCLSNQELIACNLLGKGMRNKEVAVRMNRSPQTIGTYKTRILRKLGLNSQHALEEYMRLNFPDGTSVPLQKGGG